MSPEPFKQAVVDSMFDGNRNGVFLECRKWKLWVLALIGKFDRALPLFGVELLNRFGDFCVKEFVKQLPCKWLLVGMHVFLRRTPKCLVKVARFHVRQITVVGARCGHIGLVKIVTDGVQNGALESTNCA